MDPGFLILIAMFVALYFIMIRPQQKRMKEHAALINSLEEGDMVMTNGGIYGAVAEVEDDVVWVEVAPEVELKISKQMIADKAPDDTAADADDTDDDEADEAEADEADEAELAEHGDEG